MYVYGETFMRKEHVLRTFLLCYYHIYNANGPYDDDVLGNK